MKRSQLSSFLLLLFASFIIVSCSKKDDPAPSLADQVAGNYNVTSIGASGIVIPLPFKDPIDGETMSAKIELKKVADDKVKGALTYSYKDASGKVENDDPIEIPEITLKQTSTGTIEAYEGTTKIGTYSNNELKVEMEDDFYGSISITAKK